MHAWVYWSYSTLSTSTCFAGDNPVFCCLATKTRFHTALCMFIDQLQVFTFCDCVKVPECCVDMVFVPSESQWSVVSKIKCSILIRILLSSIIYYSGEHCIFGRHCFTTSRHCTWTAGQQWWLEIADTVGHCFHKWHSYICWQRSTANQHGWLSYVHVIMLSTTILRYHRDYMLFEKVGVCWWYLIIINVCILTDSVVYLLT